MVDGVLEFPAYGDSVLPVRFVVDTGAGRTILGPIQVMELEALAGVTAKNIGAADFGWGIGGTATGRNVRSQLTLFREDGEPWTRTLDVFLLPESEDNDSRTPALLGRDILREIAVLVDLPHHAVVFYD